MTLELNKVIGQVDALAGEAASANAQSSELLDKAREWLNQYAARFKALEGPARQFNAAIPADEQLNATRTEPAMPQRFTVIGADGSTIAPDHHNAALYYLINVGSLTYRHGSGERPVAFSEPEFCYSPDQLYEGRRLVEGKLLDARRDTAEIKRLADAAESEPHDSASPPLVGLTDGALLLWAAEDEPKEEHRKKVAAYVSHLDRLKRAGAGVAAFVSRPRYADVLKLLWLAQLGEHATKQSVEDHPFLGIADRTLFNFLDPGQRSASFISPSPVNERYAETGHEIGFFYVNVGKDETEIARVEVPQWVWQSRELLDRVHGAVVAQCRLVKSYPYVLARAHELAVITTDERRQLESLVESSLLRYGLRGQPSQKAQFKGLTGSAKRRYGQ